jgi:hypothetical protein
VLQGFVQAVFLECPFPGPSTPQLCRFVVRGCSRVSLELSDELSVLMVSGRSNRWQVQFVELVLGFHERRKSMT